MTIQQQINQLLKNGVKKVETFGTKKTIEISNIITTKQSLEFCDYLRSIAINKGRNNGTLKDKTLNIISDWYDVKNGSFMIDHITSKNLKSKVDYHKITWIVDKSE